MPDDFIEVDKTPTPEEEEQFSFSGEEGRTLKIHNDILAQDLRQRQEYAERAYSLTQTWVGFIVVITLAQLTLAALGIGRLASYEFIAVLTTTTASILGFWALVGRGLFYRPPSRRD